MTAPDTPDSADEAWDRLADTLGVTPEDPGPAPPPDADEAAFVADDRARLARIEEVRPQAEAELEHVHATAWALAVAPGAMPNSFVEAMAGPISKWRTFFGSHRDAALARAAGRPSPAADAAARALAALDARQASLKEPPPPAGRGPKRP